MSDVSTGWGVSAHETHICHFRPWFYYHRYITLCHWCLPQIPSLNINIWKPTMNKFCICTDPFRWVRVFFFLSNHLEDQGTELNLPMLYSSRWIKLYSTNLYQHHHHHHHNFSYHHHHHHLYCFYQITIITTITITAISPQPPPLPSHVYHHHSHHSHLHHCHHWVLTVLVDLFILSFKKYLFSIHYVPDIVQGTNDKAVNKTNKTPCAQRASILANEIDNKQSR